MPWTTFLCITVIPSIVCLSLKLNRTRKARLMDAFEYFDCTGLISGR